MMHDRRHVYYLNNYNGFDLFDKSLANSRIRVGVST
jgi:hypothetical protein